MKKEDAILSRRKFIVASSAAVAATPFLAELTSVKAAASESTQSAAAAVAPSIPKGTKVFFIGKRCIGCHVCRTFCPSKAIHYGDGGNEIDQSKCTHCGVCYQECPNCVITRTTVN
jgi:Pyruvate/2-oxoacid:ferredoxin oxidoreductase delta subunit